MKIIPLDKEHFVAVSSIYLEGLATGVASFETEAPSWDQWDEKFLNSYRFVAMVQGEVAGWCALSAVSKRQVYSGVAEDTIYIASKFQRKGIGNTLLRHLISESEKAGFWTLQAGIFPQNKASIELHKQCGFRIIGIREKIARRDGKWYDNMLMERRSTKQFK
ncbi:MAG: GNAT family N-acetyltransferase [Altibacter sp.]|uniref:GNAT family N-acetyltransferase n=1 Tax=Altibacter sp. TaxID=2024823 RepID=UPI001E000A7A|nr:GNAT family N-acetyltransferase [Altibacter sp.]MBZ0327946.1 GNAT family N-acetyltransferase [Altibacter sp.]